MKPFRISLRAILIVLAAAMATGFINARALADSEQNPNPDDAPDTGTNIAYQQILPKDQILKFHQLNFKFDFGHLEDSDWGLVAVNADKLKKYSNGCPGFINIFANSPFSEEHARVVADLYIPATHEDGTCSLEDPAKRMVKDDPGDDAPNGQQAEIPYTRIIDLRHSGDGDGPVTEITLIALFSFQPLAHQLAEILVVGSKVKDMAFAVDPTPFNAQGGFVNLPGDDEPLPPPDQNPDNLLDPGPPPPVVAIPMDVDGFTYPTAFFQDGLPNIEAAKNQCVPVAVANALGYLERTFDSEAILKWELPHYRTWRGLGEMHVEGPLLVWEPVPEESLSANVDALMRRPFATSLDFGGITSGCNFVQGTFGYQELFGEQARFESRHQGGSAVIDPNALGGCDPAPFATGNKTSVREGVEVTWDWVHEQLTKGRAVIIRVGWYDAGQSAGGHMMRVRGVTRVGGRDYMTFVNDADQGDNYTGLEYWTVEVSDIRGPLLTAVPNGKLELDRGQNEITFAMSFEPRPTLMIF